MSDDAPKSSGDFLRFFVVVMALMAGVMAWFWQRSEAEAAGFRRANEGARNALRSSAVAVAPGLSTTQASGRSDHFGCGTAITAASATAGWPMIAFSRSTELIHSPPDLIRSLVRSEIRR